MGLVAHAKRELELAGLFEDDPDYDGMIGNAVMELIEAFANQGHSEFSASMVRDIFTRVSNFKTLTPITSDPAGWHDVSEVSGRHMLQSLRDPAIFSVDDGATWYSIDDPQDDRQP